MEMLNGKRMGLHILLLANMVLDSVKVILFKHALQIFINLINTHFHLFYAQNKILAIGKLKEQNVQLNMDLTGHQLVNVQPVLKEINGNMKWLPQLINQILNTHMSHGSQQMEDTILQTKMLLLQIWLVLSAKIIKEQQKLLLAHDDQKRKIIYKFIDKQLQNRSYIQKILYLIEQPIHKIYMIFSYSDYFYQNLQFLTDEIGFMNLKKFKIKFSARILIFHSKILKNSTLQQYNLNQMVKQFSNIDQQSNMLDSQDKSFTQECTICLSSFSDMIYLKICNHKFCYECIVKWIKVKKVTCPICRTKFNSIIKKQKRNQPKCLRKKGKFLNNRKQYKYKEINIDEIIPREVINEVQSREIMRIRQQIYIYLPIYYITIIPNYYIPFSNENISIINGGINSLQS